MAKHIWKQWIKCKACNGTGIYIGMGERDGAGIVCHDCGGMGREKIVVEWEDFEGREFRGDVKRVYQSNPGICVDASPEFGGMSYEDWLMDKPFPPSSENRKYVCPAWWYQGVNYKLKPHWDECIVGGAFSACPNFAEKERCWGRWDKEFG